MGASGLVAGTEGNVSVRTPEGDVLITPSGLDYAVMEPEDVVLVSLGAPRKFLLRPVSRSEGGAASRTFLLGRGDLLVTGGRCQREWLHSVPKVLAAGARISITFRHGLDVRAYPDEQ